jgi:arylsulfatase A
MMIRPLLYFVVATCATPLAALRSEEQPNIILVMADDLGYGHLGCYGQTKILTPKLNEMASEGTRFTQFYAGHCVCAPSRSVLMTGYHTGHTSVRINGGGAPLLPEDITVAEVLQQAGYATGCFGKWGIGDHGTAGVPYKQGFDEFFGYLHQVHAHFYYTHFLWKNDQVFPLEQNLGQQRKQYSHDEIMRESFDFIRRKSETTSPFFLYLPITIPHFELLVPEDSLQQYMSFDEPVSYVDTNGHYAAQPKPRAALAAMISRMDRDVGRLFELLRELNIDNETLVLFTSDNGGYRLAEDFFHGNGGLRGGKGTFYEGGLRVPMIVRWPGKIRANHSDPLVWAMWDIMPTIAELAGSECPQGIDGISIAQQLLRGDQKVPDRMLYWEKQPGNQGGLQPWSVAARRGKWKAVRNRPKLPLELYDLEADPAEQNDLARQQTVVAQQFERDFRDTRTASREYTKEEPLWSYKPLDTGFVK